MRTYAVGTYDHLKCESDVFLVSAECKMEALLNVLELEFDLTDEGYEHIFDHMELIESVARFDDIEMSIKEVV